jgi:hypothetical protein
MSVPFFPAKWNRKGGYIIIVKEVGVARDAVHDYFLTSADENRTSKKNRKQFVLPPVAFYPGDTQELVIKIAGKGYEQLVFQKEAESGGDQAAANDAKNGKKINNLVLSCTCPLCHKKKHFTDASGLQYKEETSNFDKEHAKCLAALVDNPAKNEHWREDTAAYHSWILHATKLFVTQTLEHYTEYFSTDGLERDRGSNGPNLGCNGSGNGNPGGKRFVQKREHVCKLHDCLSFTLEHMRRMLDDNNWVDAPVQDYLKKYMHIMCSAWYEDAADRKLTYTDACITELGQLLVLLFRLHTVNSEPDSLAPRARGTDTAITLPQALSKGQKAIDFRDVVALMDLVKNKLLDRQTAFDKSRERTPENMGQRTATPLADGHAQFDQQVAAHLQVSMAGNIGILAGNRMSPIASTAGADLQHLAGVFAQNAENTQASLAPSLISSVGPSAGEALRGSNAGPFVEQGGLQYLAAYDKLQQQQDLQNGAYTRIGANQHPQQPGFELLHLAPNNDQGGNLVPFIHVEGQNAYAPTNPAMHVRESPQPQNVCAADYGPAPHVRQSDAYGFDQPAHVSVPPNQGQAAHAHHCHSVMSQPCGLYAHAPSLQARPLHNPSSVPLRMFDHPLHQQLQQEAQQQHQQVAESHSSTFEEVHVAGQPVTNACLNGLSRDAFTGTR